MQKDLSKFNMVSPPKASGECWKARAAGALRKPPRGQRRQPLGERRGARSTKCEAQGARGEWLMARAARSVAPATGRVWRARALHSRSVARVCRGATRQQTRGAAGGTPAAGGSFRQPYRWHARGFAAVLYGRNCLVVSRFGAYLTEFPS